MKFVMLRAETKQTKLEYKGQIAINDATYEDVATSSDYWTVWANELLVKGWYDEVEIWYQENDEHPVGTFEHSSGMKEIFWPTGYLGIENYSADVLFVRGAMKSYTSVLNTLDTFKVYYPSGPYYCPSINYQWGLCFVEDIRHIKIVEDKTGAPVELFKKSCVGKYFQHKAQKEYDICFVCCAPIAKRKRLLFLKYILQQLKSENVSALVIGLKDPELIVQFDGLNVDFIGWIPRTKIGKQMARCKIGVVLSDMKGDGCPRVIQEFLATGLPIAVSKHTCCSSIYLNKKTGIVAADVDMAEAILDLLAITSLMDVEEFYRTSISLGASVRHFVENMKKHGGPVNAKAR